MRPTKRSWCVPSASVQSASKKIVSFEKPVAAGMSTLPTVTASAPGRRRANQVRSASG